MTSEKIESYKSPTVYLAWLTLFLKQPALGLSQESKDETHIHEMKNLRGTDELVILVPTPWSIY